MAVSVEVYPDYAALYGVDASQLPAPLVGESVRDYVRRSGLGNEEDILAVIDEVSKPMTYVFRDGDALKIYPMAASG